VHRAAFGAIEGHAKDNDTRKSSSPERLCYWFGHADDHEKDLLRLIFLVHNPCTVPELQ
jgi:hypothetical protein